jgi:ATP-dependent helicase/nuclease subunit A
VKLRVASAGTGKTTSLVRRFLELIGAGTPLRRLAGVTFTGVGAAELRTRVGAGIAEARATGRFVDLAFPPAYRPRFEEAALELKGTTLTTIHGFMAAALRLSAPLLGLDPDFGKLDEWEAKALFEEELATLRFLARTPEHALHAPLQRLAGAAEELCTQLFAARSLAERYHLAEAAGERERDLLALFEAVYARYRTRLGAQLLAPSEIERRALELTRHPAALARLRARYQVLLIDEFQDVNPVQGRFFEALETAGLTLEVVGDPKQAIYGFRHADVEVFRGALRRASARGEVTPPLTATHRHAQVVTRFLNHLTRTFAAQGWGFSAAEAPEVTCVGPQAEKRGRVEIHWVTGEAAMNELRAYEARVLAERLASLEGYAPHEMAVLARSYRGLAQIEGALRALGVPATMLQGRGYFERLEIRDLYHALRVGLDPQGLSLAAWLRGPFAGLALGDVERVVLSEAPLATLERLAPEVFARLEQLREVVRRAPVEALKALIRAPLVGGQRYADFLGPRARENVDALLFAVATHPPRDVGALLEGLERLSRQEEAGDVPQSGSGISLLTVHRAKGLEWPVVALFDLGRFDAPRASALHVAPGSGEVALKGSGAFAELEARARDRSAEESYRLLYVAASRARDVLLISGSVKGGRPRGWAAALSALGLGPETHPWTRSDFVLRTWPVQRVAPQPAPPADQAALPAAPWSERRFPAPPYPPLCSPSTAVALAGDAGGEESHEPLPIADPDEGEFLPGRARAVGTLVHYAVSQNWSARRRAHLRNLEAQEVMFAFSAAERAEILTEVTELLSRYEALLGTALPALAARETDLPELPFALPLAGTVWQGVIDRLYCAGGRWYLDDYKTDHTTQPERYYRQLGLYARAVEAVRGLRPEVRLVYLRAQRVIRVPHEVLEGALAELLAGADALKVRR